MPLSLASPPTPSPRNVTRVADAARLVGCATGRHGLLEVLVNNAGVILSRTSVGKCTDEDWQRTLEADLTPVFRCSKAALPLLAAARGCIVNVAPTAGAHGSPALSAYAAAKAGVINLTKSMAARQAPARAGPAGGGVAAAA